MTSTPVESKPGLRHTVLSSIRGHVGATSLAFKVEHCTLKPMTEGLAPSLREVAMGPKDPVPPNLMKWLGELKSIVSAPAEADDYRVEKKMNRNSTYKSPTLRIEEDLDGPTLSIHVNIKP